jgi:DNA-binding NarL/FixJ family response regulator
VADWLLCASVHAPAETVNVVIVEDHVALRRGLELLLRDTDCRVIGTADDAETAQSLVERRRPDVAIVDINLPGRSGIELTRNMLADNPDLGVLLYTGIDDQETLSSALDCGARGFALKAGPPEELLTAIRAVAAGETYVDARLRPLLLARLTTERIGVLSPREREVLDLLAQGLTGEDVAARLSLSPETVRTHVRNAMDKLEAHTRVHAVAIALRQGEI